ncbi:hypothetical protein DFH94DRAFT_781237 [Russula ochroleuca]|uniref:SET domain-containing protein n=1 Tax=Russula ochroleuca TaxID=152965 RepID=A0A9P5JVB7_9AGAM|nr:hypothetical protein DFH94DRAFT_781237 [Russula ochroleuca]
MSLDASTSDNTDPLATQDQVPSSNEDDEKIQENRTLAFLVYREVWDEFNKWKLEDCKRQLRLLEQPLPPPNIAEAAHKMASAFLTDGDESGDVEIIYICDTDDDIPLDVGGATVLTCETVSLKLPPDFAPHPPYESCTPAVQTIALRENEEQLPFIPYADDPTWDIGMYLSQYEAFAWENLVDPDVEVIQFEVLRRLHFGHRLSLDDIDATCVLLALRPNNRFGLIYQMTQRDELFWPGMMAEFPTADDGSERRGFNFRAHEPDVDDLRGRIESVIPRFCANPGCIHTHCHRHGNTIDDFASPPAAVPRLTSKDYPEGASCGSLCFREIDSSFQEDSVQWGSSEVDELRCILEIMPDTIPCGLAKLVRRPCREVFIERRRFIPDEKVYSESSRVVTAREKLNYYKDSISGDITSGAYIPPGPCSHIGPCDKNNANCICAQKSVHCTRSCHCSLTCKHRWPGCRCNKETDKKITQTCKTESCRCRKMGWECDSMVCECDNHSYVHRRKPRPKTKQPRMIRPDGKHYCQNSDIQRGLAAELEIKRGAFGLGCFAVKKIRPDQFIGEYVGELSVSAEDKRELLRKHVGLNYSFGLNLQHIIDSARVGNETRYINHGTEEDGLANASAKTTLVLGEPRIALYATKEIKAGGEILFDYGENYWIWKS